jgi:hypothetical protein
MERGKPSHWGRIAKVQDNRAFLEEMGTSPRWPASLRALKVTD